MQRVINLSEAENADLVSLRDSSNEALLAVAQIRMAIKNAEAQENGAANEVAARNKKVEDRLDLIFKAHGVAEDRSRIRWQWDQKGKTVTMVLPDIQQAASEGGPPVPKRKGK